MLLLANFARRRVVGVVRVVCVVILYPAIDLRGGRCVRLVQGAFDQETCYDDDPVAVARQFCAAGAQWLHVVDLDAARRQGDNRDVIEALAAVVTIPLQVGGGVHDPTSLERLLDRGVARVVVGSLAVEDPEAVRRLAADHPGCVAVGLDHRDGEVRVRGWAQGSSIGLAQALAAVDCEPLGAIVVTEIGRDRMVTGPDLDGLAAVPGAHRHPDHRLGRGEQRGRPAGAGGPAGWPAPGGGGSEGWKASSWARPSMRARSSWQAALRAWGLGAVRTVGVIPLPGRRRRPGGEGGQVPEPSATPGTPSSLAARYGAEGPTRWSSTTSRHLPGGERRWCRWWPGPPSRCSYP